LFVPPDLWGAGAGLDGAGAGLDGADFFCACALPVTEHAVANATANIHFSTAEPSILCIVCSSSCV
jgi:hypothetical protein